MNTKKAFLSHFMKSVVALVVVLASAQPARADIDGLMGDIFQMYVNVTPTGVMETQRRGGLTLGSVVMRNRIVKPNVINVQAPSIRGGCGGLDVFGGSFSFINAAQLTSLLQSIASNALAYAFTLALEGVCPTCMQKIEKLAGWMNDLNKYMQDSCQAGKWLVNQTGLEEWHEGRMSDSKKKDTNAGVFADFFESYDQFRSNLASDTARGETSAQNVVWSAMTRSGVGSWFGAFNDTSLREALMSVTGTILYSDTNQAGAQCLDSDGERDYCIEVLPPTLTMEHFVNGGIDGGTIQIYRCGGAGATCLSPTLTTDPSWKGFREHVKEIIFGAAPAYTGGLIYKLRDGTPTPTATEQGFVEGAPIAVRKLLEAAGDSWGSMHTLGERIEAVVSNQVAGMLVSEAINSINTAVQNEDNVVARGHMSELLKDRRDEFKVRQDQWDRELEEVHQLYDLVAIMSKASRGAKQGDLPLTGGATRTVQ